MKEYARRLSAVNNADIYVRLLKLLTVEKLYLNPDVTAASLAERLDCKPRHISGAVLVATGNNYSHLINTLRLKEVCRRLTSSRYKDSTIEDIGLTCGYQSRQAFYVAFKRQMGCTPAEWRERGGKM